MNWVYSFNGADGLSPYAGLIQARDGNLYGTTALGGANGTGTVFRITTEGALTTLYTFSALSNGGIGINADGGAPLAGLTQATDGNFYGTTSVGGANGAGTIFRITKGGTLTTLYTFGSTANDGGSPHAGLIQATNGNLYGTTAYPGTIFQITTGGTLTTLARGGEWLSNAPNAGLIQGRDGYLYGTTFDDGANGTGTIFRITTEGALTTLYTFSALSNGNYGTNLDGAYPLAGLMQASDGNLYGTTQEGGVNGVGTIFRITPGGTFTTLYTFSALNHNTNTDGSLTYASLIQANDGNLYGATTEGGANACGTIFSLDVGLTMPTLTNLAPSTTNAAGAAFTLTLKGTGFNNSATVNWTQGTTATPLNTTYLSSTLLKAMVPASLITTPGNATLTVSNAGTLASRSKPFSILLTTLNLLSAQLTRTGAGSYTANITLKNEGHLTAPNVTVTKASLGTATTSTTLPVTLGSITASKTGTTSLSFPGSAGSSGSVVALKVTGTFTGGTFSGSLKVKLP